MAIDDIVAIYSGQTMDIVHGYRCYSVIVDIDVIVVIDVIVDIVLYGGYSVIVVIDVIVVINVIVL